MCPTQPLLQGIRHLLRTTAACHFLSDVLIADPILIPICQFSAVIRVRVLEYSGYIGFDSINEEYTDNYSEKKK